MKIVKQTYYGRTLKEALEFCLDDKDFYDNKLSYRVIGAKRTALKCKVGWTTDKVERYSFDCEIINKG